MIHRHSRYQFSIFFKSRKGDFLGLRPSIDKRPRPDDRFHIVSVDDRLDTLAHRYLGSTDLWWVIADYNDIFFPLELEIGATLRLPAAGRIQMEIFK